MVTEELFARTSLDLPSIRARFKPVLGNATLGPVQGTTVLDEPADLSFVAQKTGLAGGWAVQVYVFDRGSTRDVTVVAVGDGVFATLMGGARKSVSLGKSRPVAQKLIQALK